MLNVALGRQAAHFQEADAFAHELPQLLGPEAVFALLPHACRNIRIEVVHQLCEVRLHVAEVQVRADQPHAAVDVVADAAG